VRASVGAMIEVERVSKRYGATVAVAELSFTVARGELLVLLGESGCAKTTTLKMINRLIEPTTGRVRIGGEDVSAAPGHELRRRIGYVFQRIGLFPHLTVAENVAITPRLLGWEEGRIRARVDELLALVELEPAVHERMPDQLSGGQQQRVGVARALAAGPRVLLLDEPFGALDPLTRVLLQDSLRSIRTKLDLTAVLVTHDVAEALLLGDRVAVMRDGRFVQIGTPAELLHSAADEYVQRFLETPLRQTRELAPLLGVR
jgi:osmoprotectant transport system ATP-binding protein